VVNPAGAFLLPTLFLRIQDALGSFDLAVSNVTGAVVFGPSGSIERLSTAFEIDSGGPTGVLQVTVVAAALPEPGGLALAAAGVGLLLASRRGRAG
jgi:hypothetical protein